MQWILTCALLAAFLWYAMGERREGYTAPTDPSFLSSMQKLVASLTSAVNNTPTKTKKPVKTAAAATTAASSGAGGWKPAYATYYNSYPDCCKKSPHYNPKAPKEECSSYDGCEYLGQFSGIKGRLTYDQVKARNIVSFYDAKNQSKTCNKKNQECAWWNTNVKGKKIAIKHPGTGKELVVEPLDTCNDADTSNKDCTKNANKGGGTLIDMEIFTARRFWPNGKETNGKILWKFVS